jgi:hypothetical protein
MTLLIMFASTSQATEIKKLSRMKEIEKNLFFFANFAAEKLKLILKPLKSDC